MVGISSPAAGVPGLDLLPHVRRIALALARQPAELFLRRLELPERDLRQALGRQVDPLVEAQLLAEALRTEPKGSTAPRGQLFAQVADVGPQGVDGVGRRVGQVAQQVHVLQVAEGPRQVALDERQDPLERLDADADEEARGLRHVLPGRLQQPRRLAQLRPDAPRPLRDVGVGEEDLRGEAAGQRVGVEERVPLPIAGLLEGEQPAADAVGQHPLLERLLAGQAGRVDAVEAPRPAPEVADARLDGGAAEVLQQVVVQMDAVGGRFRGTGLVEMGEVLVNEMRERLGCLRQVSLSRPAHDGVSSTTERGSPAGEPSSA